MLDHHIHLVMQRVDHEFVGPGLEIAGNATGQESHPIFKVAFRILDSARQSEDVLGHFVGDVQEGIGMFGQLLRRIL